MHPHQKIITRAIEHIRSQQLSDGSFLSLSSTNPDDFSEAISYKTTFFTSNILLSLRGLKNPDVLETQQKAVAFILEQKSTSWSFNYFARNIKEKLPSPYPDDLDDTFLALAAIIHYKPAEIDGKTLAGIVRLLNNLEVEEGGPFRTWLVPDDCSKQWRDVDIIVNSNIGYFLSLINVEIPAIKILVAEALKKDRLASPYYPGLSQVLYFISRFWGKQKNIDISLNKLLVNMLNDRAEEHFEQFNLLQQAMMMCSLINVDQAERITADRWALFLETIEYEGFKPHAFCIDPQRNGKRSYAGSSALTAALCVEALANYCPAKEDLSPHAHIQNRAREESEKIEPELRAHILKQIEKTSDEKITILAYETQKILAEKKIFIPPELTENLAIANLYGWMAYTIYDHTVDGEEDPLLIPCANYFSRKLANIYHSLDKEIPGTSMLFNKTMDAIDGALAWEQKHCRLAPSLENILQQPLPEFRDYNNLASRSIGHALGPLTILLSLGYGANSEEYNNVMDLFRHYLIARQLHDDAHDWEEDLLHGRINSVCALLLKFFQEKYSGEGKTIGLNAALPELRKLFWEEIIDEATRLILFHATAAIEAREKSAVFSKTDFMEKIIDTLGINAQKALHDRDQALEFLSYYAPMR